MIEVYWLFSLLYKFVDCHISILLIVIIYRVFNSIADFSKELSQFVVKAGQILSNLYGTDWENRLKV